MEDHSLKNNDRTLAVIDLGTNTFHLLIVEVEKKGAFKEIFRERRFAKLASEGIESIGERPFQIGLEIIKDFKRKLEEYEVEQVSVLGTAALRRASNGQEFIKEVRNLTKLEVDLISGEEEAYLIYHGVKKAVPFSSNPDLIIDIGGGSVEFIIGDEDKIIWAKSFKVGIAVLFNKFHKNDPISEDEIEAIYTFLSQELSPLIEIIHQYNPKRLIGASGAFEVVENMLPQYIQNPFYSKIPIDEFYPLFHLMLESNLPQRLNMPGLPATRADLIVVAYLLIHFVLQQTDFQYLIVSAYAMKEGKLSQMI